MSKFQRGVEQLLKALYSMRNSIILSCASGETVRGLPVLQVDAGVTVPPSTCKSIYLFARAETLLCRASRMSLLGRLVHRRSSICWVTLAASLGLEGIIEVILMEGGVKVHCN
jgi:hypothetical protein